MIAKPPAIGVCCDQLRFPGHLHSFGSEDIQSDWTQGLNQLQQLLQAKVRFHLGIPGTSRSHFRSLSDLSNHQPCHVASRKDSEVRSFHQWWTPVVDGSRWVTTSMVWHPNDPFKNKIHEIFPQKKKHKKHQRHN